jgi:tetratricopeptide (TPR) repeat protein
MSRILNPSSRLLRRLALALVVASALGSAGWLWWACDRRPDVAFLPRLAPAEWIIYPSSPEGTVHPRVELSTVFQRSFNLERAPTKARLSLAGFRQYALSVNGKPAAAPARRGRNWKQPDLYDVAPDLRPGENQIVVKVANSNAPPVLWLSLEADGFRLSSDETWQTSYAGATWRPARLASKPKIAVPGNLLYGGERPWASLCARWQTLLLFAALSAAAYWLLNSRWRTAGHAPAAADYLPLLILAIAWIAVFANNLGVLPNLVGYDVDGHMAYIRYIQEHRSLPRANEGWEMFQPPLYYLLGAALLSAFHLSVTQDSGVVVLRLMGMVIGITHFVLVWASLRLLFPGERAKARWGLALAATLPPLLYLSQYVSNEGLAAALVSGAVFLTLRLLRQESVSWKAEALLGFCLGAALLTKATALLAVPAVFGALAWKTWLTPRPDIARSARRLPQLFLALSVCLAVCAGHYVRLWSQFGSPLIGVWDPRLGFSWWQDDGYRTGAFYLRFGAVLGYPWFSSFKSFGDGVYATLWGDGLLGGGADAVARPPWNYDLMAVGYWLALLPTLALVVGAVLMVVKFLRHPSPDLFLVLGLAFLAALALLHMSIALPYQCHVKAFYVLCALVPLCAFGACGLDALCRWSGKTQHAICLLLCLWALNSLAAFWIPRRAAATYFSRAQSLWKEGPNSASKGLLQAGLQQAPDNAELRTLQAGLLLAEGDLPGAVREAETALRSKPDSPKAHLVLSAVLARQQQIEAAIEQARQALRFAPGDIAGYEQLAHLLFEQERYSQTIPVARQGLAVGPFNSMLRFALGSALVFQGEIVEAMAQLQLASAVRPEWAEPHVMLGATLARQGDLEQANEQLREAIRLEPGNAGAHSQLAAVLSVQHQPAEAVAHYTEALRLSPDRAEAWNNLAWIRAASPQAEVRNGPEAVRLAERACKITEFKEPMMMGTLAVAYAEAGRFEEAVAMARKARELALAAGQHELAEKDEKLIALFTARQPYREPSEP